ncbi:MAG: RNA polymerase sigma factor [Deltaproteobacteria bacterium]|nr:RNA polymerase sigma factor [Deltaproteobacteria bacterium]MBI3078761.1 RNA polymerase sigma factor [Deltaproteobacteria bacterium]
MDAGWRRRFEDLTLPYLPEVYRVALGLTGRPADAEDLAQETYLRAFQAFRRSPPDRPRPWLLTILYRLWIDAHRKEQRRPTGESFEEDRHSPLDPQGTAPDARQADRIRRALQELPSQQRAAVLLCDGEGYSYAEIATILDAPIGTIRTWIHRGRALLRQALTSAR